MTKEEFEAVTDLGEFHTIRYHSASKGGIVDIHMFVKVFDHNYVKLMDERGKFLNLRYDKIVGVA